MTVRELRKALSGLDGSLQVYWADHDHNEFEVNDLAGNVYVIDKNKGVKDWHKKALTLHRDITPNKYVVIRP